MTELLKVGDRPFVGQHGKGVVNIEIDLDSLVDKYYYHDFPPNVSLYLHSDELERLINTLNSRLSEMKKLEQGR